VEVFEPEGEVEFSGGEIAAGDEAEDGVLNFSGEFGERVAGSGAGDGVEFVEAELIIDGDGGRRVRRQGFAGAGGEGGVDVGCQTLRDGAKDESGDGLQGGELRVAEILGDVDGTVVDELLEAKAGGGLGGAVWQGDVLIFRADGHDTTLLMMRTAYVRVLIGRWKGEEKSLLKVRGSPPKVVCRFG
jgi:hypothetical protein